MSSSSRSCDRSEPPRAARAVRLARRAFLACAALAACAVLGAQAAAAEAWKVVEDRWFELWLGGSRCGFVHELVERSGDVVRTTAETEMTVGRMGQGVRIRTLGTFEESGAGVPLRARVRRETGAAPVESSWEFRADGIEVREEQGGRVTAQRRPLPPAGWLTPRAAREFVKARLAAGAREFAYVTLDPASGPDAVRIESVRTGESSGTVDGRSVALTEWRTRNSLIEKPSVELLSADAVVVRSTTDLGVGILESRLSTREAASARVAPVEVMARTFVPLAVDARSLAGSRRAELSVRARDGELPDLPSAASQRFERSGKGAAALRIDADGGSEASGADRADQALLRASVFADADDAEVRALAERALRGAPGDMLARAELLRAAVNRHIARKDLASGFATASETVRARAGDCTEHAALLCALLRTQGIPARVASGLVYVAEGGGIRNAYGWHMWTQAIVGGRWIDLDATIAPGGPRFDAARLLVGLSKADGAAVDTDLARIVDLMGDLVIEPVSADGVRFGAGQSP